MTGGVDQSPAQWSLCPGCPKCQATDGYVLRRGSWRCTSAHEYVYQFVRGTPYFSDATACAEEVTQATNWPRQQGGTGASLSPAVKQRNPRTVWRLGSEPMDLQMCRACKAVYRGREFTQLPRRDKLPVCRCGVQDWVSHFAAFPSELVRRCLVASISKAGCCSVCGAAWAPIVERRRLVRKRPRSKTKRIGSTGTGNHCDNDVAGIETVILGYRPTCGCNAEAVPCRVLDPFAGSGTTLWVAEGLGCEAVGIELNPDYALLAEARLSHRWMPRKRRAGSATMKSAPRQKTMDFMARSCL